MAGLVIQVPATAVAVSGGGAGTTNTLPRFAGGGLLTDSAATDDGTTFAIARNTLQLNTGTSINFGTTLARLSSPADKQILIRGGSGGAGNDNRLVFGGTAAGNCYILQNVTDFIFRSTTTDAPTGVSTGQLTITNTTFRALQGNAAGAGVSMGQTGQYVWTNNNLGSSGTMDTGLARDAAGIVRVTDASTGIAFLRAKRNRQTTATDITLTALQSGDTIDSTGTCTITLPVPTAGVWFTLNTASAHAMTVSRQTSGQIFIAATGANTYASAATKGNNMIIWSDGTDWFAVVSGTWT